MHMSSLLYLPRTEWSSPECAEYSSPCSFWVERDVIHIEPWKSRILDSASSSCDLMQSFNTPHSYNFGFSSKLCGLPGGFTLRRPCVDLLPRYAAVPLHFQVRHIHINHNVSDDVGAGSCCTFLSPPFAPKGGCRGPFHRPPHPLPNGYLCNP